MSSPQYEPAPAYAFSQASGASHAPQSASHEKQSSSTSQSSSPHDSQASPSAGQSLHDSGGAHDPSPHQPQPSHASHTPAVHSSPRLHVSCGAQLQPCSPMLQLGTVPVAPSSPTGGPPSSSLPGAL